MSAACAGRNINLWYDDRRDSTATEYAKSICAGCSIRSACLDGAVRRREQFGVWGGLHTDDRRELGLLGGLVRYDNCGTDAGYRRHMRNKTATCAPCRAAHSAATSVHAKQRRAAS